MNTVISRFERLSRAAQRAVFMVLAAAIVTGGLTLGATYAHMMVRTAALTSSAHLG